MPRENCKNCIYICICAIWRLVIMRIRLRTLHHRKDKNTAVHCTQCKASIIRCRRDPWGRYYCADTCGKRMQRRIDNTLRQNCELKEFIYMYPTLISYINPAVFNIVFDIDLTSLPSYIPHLTKTFVHNPALYNPPGLRNCHHCRRHITEKMRTRYFRQRCYCNKCYFKKKREFELYEKNDRILYLIIDVYPNIRQYLRYDVQKWLDLR